MCKYLYVGSQEMSQSLCTLSGYQNLALEASSKLNIQTIHKNAKLVDDSERDSPSSQVDMQRMVYLGSIGYPLAAEKLSLCLCRWFFPNNKLINCHIGYIGDFHGFPIPIAMFDCGMVLVQSVHSFSFIRIIPQPPSLFLWIFRDCPAINLNRLAGNPSTCIN